MISKIRQKLVKVIISLSVKNINLNLKKIKSFQKSSKEQLESYQKEKLIKILTYSYKHIPYYREVLKKAEVIDENLEVNLNNFNKIPILTKSIIKEKFEDLKSDELHKMKWNYNTSGGSTGEPIKVIQDKNYFEWNIANKLFYKESSGVNMGCKELRFWGSSKESNNQLFILIRNKIYNRKELNVANMSSKDLKKYVKIWNSYCPKWVEGYTEALYEFAKFVDSNNLEVHSPKGILSTAGTLYPSNQKFMENVFKCKVYNRYGSRETGDIAFGRDRLRLSTWNHYIEVLNSKTLKSAKTGNVYVTTLNNYAMPLIRYNIGDIATKDPEWDYLKDVKGREISVFLNKNGDLIDASYFAHNLSSKSWVKKFQIVQKDYNHIEYILKLDPKSEKPTKEEFDTLEKIVKKKMGNDCFVTFTISENIKSLNSGKYLFTRCEIKK